MTNQNVLITGGSSGIGKAMVEAFAEKGYTVWFTYNQGADRAEELVKALKTSKVRAFQLDQGKPECIEKLLSLLPGKIDILILNAALGTKTVQKYASTPALEDLALMQVNALGPLWLATKVLPQMRVQGVGKIIFISSVDGGVTHFPGARHSDGMSKAAVTHFAKHLAAELVNEPIDVFTICPGATNTPMFQASTLDHLSQAEKKAFCEALPGGRLVEPREIAELALFLCSNSGRILRGASLDASLGLGNNPTSINQKRRN